MDSIRRWWIEEKNSGKGFKFNGTREEVIREAQGMTREATPVMVVWTDDEPPHTRTAEVDAYGARWVKD